MRPFNFLTQLLFTGAMVAGVAAQTVSAGAQTAAPASLVQITLSAERLVSGPSADKPVWKAVTAQDSIAAGERVRYDITIHNRSGRAVSGLVINEPIPTGTAYEIGSATAESNTTSISFSVVNAEDFTAQPMIEDKKGHKRPATADEYRAVRWTCAGQLAADATTTAAYEVVVR